MILQNVPALPVPAVQLLRDVSGLTCAVCTHQVSKHGVLSMVVIAAKNINYSGNLTPPPHAPALHNHVSNAENHNLRMVWATQKVSCHTDTFPIQR
eukprot:1491596-Rhodomonas_salina.3